MYGNVWYAASVLRALSAKRSGTGIHLALGMLQQRRTLVQVDGLGDAALLTLQGSLDTARKWLRVCGHEWKFLVAWYLMQLALRHGNNNVW
jgi:hypothetical protein